MKVKSAVARSQGAALHLEGLELDEPRPDEVLVKLIASGVAQADLDAIDGRMAIPLPFVPGSEGAGIVERVGGDIRDLSPGDAVVVSFDSCGRCHYCATGRPRACVDFIKLNQSGRRLDGSTPFIDDDGHAIHGRFFGQSSFATHLVCRASSAVKVSSDAPLEILACLGGEMLLGAGAVLHDFQLRSGDSLVINGAGAVGLIATMVAKARGAALIVVADPNESRRTRASDVGASVTVHGAADLPEMVRSLASDGAQFALETTGLSVGRKACLASLTRGGRCALVDPPPGIFAEFDDQSAENRPLTLPADSHASPSLLIEELTALHATGALSIEQLIDFFAFDHVNDALDALRRGDVVKPVLRFPLGGFGELDRALVEGAAEDSPPEIAPSDQETEQLVKS